VTLTVTLVGGPTAVLDLDGFRIVTDPTFDPPGQYRQEGAPITLVKTAGPALSPEEIAPVHLVLASHEHDDNLDRTGRMFLASSARAFTTPDAAARFGEHVTGLADYESATVTRPDGNPLTVTAVPARHGPEAVLQQSGQVAGFVLSGEDCPRIYVSGDNASVEVVAEIQEKCGPIDVAVLFAGGAGFKELADGADLTLGNDAALAVSKILSRAVIVPIHADSWAHFRQTTAQMRELFEANGHGDKLLVLSPGETATVPPAGTADS
jgi:L-ascorbate metabolism protein UlaG (beta-lactamase superfamily)